MIKDKKLFLLDIDGTIRVGQNLIGETKRFLKEIKERDGQFVFITNNATKSIEEYIREFRAMGLQTDETNYITASHAAVHFLKEQYPGQKIYVMGTKSFVRELERNRINVTTDCKEEGIACVLVSYDDELRYDKVRDTCRILSTKDVGYVATNPDLVCPIEFGFVPDCGSICQMIGNAVKRVPYFIGKPEILMIEMALQLNPYTKEQTLVVGDRLYTDILCGVRGGIETALVLTGEATREDVGKNEYKPDYIYETITDLYKEWRTLEEGDF